MLDNLFGPHLSNLSRSMDRTTQRHALVSQNLANVNTPGYKRRDVEFGIELEQAESRFQLNRRREAQVQVFEASNRMDGNSVDLEMEVAALAETEARYRMLTDMTNRYFSGLRNVIREGR